MSTDITSYISASLEEKRAYAQTLSSAGDLLPDSFLGQIKNPETGLMERRIVPGKILMIAETGAMLGIHPMAAIQGIDVIEGHPTIKPSLMSALVRDRGFRLRSWLTGTIEGGDIAAHATLVRPDDPEFTYESTWTPFDAIRAGKVDSYEADGDGIWRIKARSEKDKPLPWEAFTKRLLRWRVIGDVCSEGAEDVLLGVHYMPDELTPNVTVDGGVLQVAEAPSAPARPWKADIAAAKTKDDLLDIRSQAMAAGEWSDTLQTELLTRIGMLNRDDSAGGDPE
ncbi:hypothetical protein MN032_17690 [Agromyces atrinae]|uniref:hypothetical protein n=1 Tax=Agromyces atrinae TaxID=592376 RepID=UPI001F59C0B7|nr:hypothetical protein [Agromyces atrinae]MCI2959521.1 hypothetical protein [Agromyces atrinae]